MSAGKSENIAVRRCFFWAADGRAGLFACEML